MKKLKTLALALAAFTALVVFAGFTSGKGSSAPHDPVFEELKDQKPVALRCLEFIDGQLKVVAIATACQPLEGSSCILTTCPDKAADKDMKVIVFRCVRNGKTVALANGCMTATDSYCTPSTCPPGTSAVGSIDPFDPGAGSGQ